MARASQRSPARPPRTTIWQDKRPSRRERIAASLRRLPRRYNDEPGFRLVLAVVLAVGILVLATLKWG